MNDTPHSTTQDQSGFHADLTDRRRPGRPTNVSPHLVPLLRDAAGTEVAPTDAIDAYMRELYLAREERLRTALGKDAIRAHAQQAGGSNLLNRCVAKVGSFCTAAALAVADRLVPTFRERRPEDDYHDTKYLGSN